MIVVLQRVKRASVHIEAIEKAAIGTGLLVLLGIESADTLDDINWICRKIANMRIFADQQGVMNNSILETDGDVLIVSQFTLHASTKKGNRPSYIKAARPEIAIPLYEQFIEEMSKLLGKPVPTGEFGADMQVSLVNDGPVTIVLDSKNKV
ncbi:D-aminoacyl-tRNA deacylase [Cyclobacterium qasimii]|uniref:D-aminoacyl-tRNA deacylase n=1 Tax=Cyclobacterium qasimii TaxID=1350429 RepID=A0A512CEP8_9BACT|nr:D-aminoacyl-tRNA deacylase [Cyclobacterium qasimii]GEO22707.1 D-aminoacyl-tRNA deacylase [Cyclobacterium qasimii]